MMDGYESVEDMIKDMSNLINPYAEIGDSLDDLIKLSERSVMTLSNDDRKKVIKMMKVITPTACALFSAVGIIGGPMSLDDTSRNFILAIFNSIVLISITFGYLINNGVEPLSDDDDEVGREISEGIDLNQFRSMMGGDFIDDIDDNANGNGEEE